MCAQRSSPNSFTHARSCTSSSRIHDPFTGAYESPTLFQILRCENCKVCCHRSGCFLFFVRRCRHLRTGCRWGFCRGVRRGVINVRDRRAELGLGGSNPPRTWGSSSSSSFFFFSRKVPARLQKKPDSANLSRAIFEGWRLP